MHVLIRNLEEISFPFYVLTAFELASDSCKIGTVLLQMLEVQIEEQKLLGTDDRVSYSCPFSFHCLTAAFLSGTARNEGTGALTTGCSEAEKES